MARWFLHRQYRRNRTPLPLRDRELKHMRRNPLPRIPELRMARRFPHRPHRSIRTLLLRDRGLKHMRHDPPRIPHHQVGVSERVRMPLLGFREAGLLIPHHLLKAREDQTCDLGGFWKYNKVGQVIRRLKDLEQGQR